MLNNKPFVAWKILLFVSTSLKRKNASQHDDDVGPVILTKQVRYSHFLGEMDVLRVSSKAILEPLT